MKKMALLLLLIVAASLAGPVGHPQDSTLEDEIRVETDPRYDFTMREAQLKLSREMGTDPLFSGL
jgi:hypothetical protein